MGSLEGSSLVFITFITPLQPDMPGSLLRMRSTASSQHTRTASCPLSHRPQYPHPQVHGSSPVGSEFCQVSPRAPPPNIPHSSAHTGRQRSLHSPHAGAALAAVRTGPESWHFLAHPRGSNPSSAYPALPPPLLTGSSVGVQGEPEQRESQQGGEDPDLGNHPSFPQGQAAGR